MTSLHLANLKLLSLYQQSIDSGKTFSAKFYRNTNGEWTVEESDVKSFVNIKGEGE